MREIKKGTFMWAVEQMKQGKKVRISSWSNNDAYFTISNGAIKYQEKTTTEINLNHLNSTDWVVVDEPNKTLFNKRDVRLSKVIYEESDVSEALKEFMDWLNDDEPKENIYTYMAKEVFGEELLR